ncbi:MAG TPA: Ig-like domain-containing protein [Gemmatimonadaceae bacterium]
MTMLTSHKRFLMMVATVVAACSSGSTDVETTATVGSVSITPATTTVPIGAQTSLQALVQDPSGRPITGTDIFWSVQNPAIATISSAGVVSGVALGSTQAAASVNGKSGIATITVSKIPVASVVVTPPQVDASPGDRARLSATVYDATQNPLGDRAITWSTSNAAVATVDSSGMVTAVNTGSATITATADGKNGTATVTVAQASVATIAVTPSPLSMTVGQQTQLTATLKDVAGSVLTGRTVTWSSANTGIATVSAEGVLAAVAAGSTTITATSEGKSGTVAVTISNVAVGSVVVQPQGPSIVRGSSVQLSVTVRDVNGDIAADRVVTWTSSAPAQAIVSPTGVVTGIAPGVVIITATSEEKSGTTSVTVTQPPVGSVTVAPSSVTVPTSKTATLTATVRDVLGGIVTNVPVAWSSSNPAIASVSAGVVTGVAAGTATIQATSGGKSGSSSITVLPVPVSSVVVQPSTASLAAGSTTQLTAVTKDSAGGVLTGRSLSWASSNPAAATVSVTGLVTAVAPGNATITATSEGKSGTSAITVNVSVASVTITPATATIPVTQTKAFAATTKDAQGSVLTGRLVTWSSSNAAIAGVSSSGVATGVAPGTVTITATSEGKSGVATLTVNPVPVSSVTITPPSPDTVFVGSTRQLAAVTKDSAGGVLTGRVVTWQSNKNNVATVDATGLVTGVSEGNANITATSEGKSSTNTVVSIKPPVASVAISPRGDSVTTTGSTKTKTLTATVRDAAGKIVTEKVDWTATPGAVASVGPSSGPSTTVTGKSVGQAQIVASSEKKADTVSIKVMLAVTTVTLSPTGSTLSLATNPTVQFSATATNGGTTIAGRTIAWSSSNSAVATVDASGKVTAKAVGTTNITAVAVFDGVTSSFPVTITVNP